MIVIDGFGAIGCDRATEVIEGVTDVLADRPAGDDLGLLDELVVFNAIDVLGTLRQDRVCCETDRS